MTTPAARVYDVDITVREHWTVRVEAASPQEARQKAARGEYSISTPHSDREFTGFRVRRVTDAA